MKGVSRNLIGLLLCGSIASANLAGAEEIVREKATVGTALKKITKALKNKGISKLPSTAKLVASNSTTSAFQTLMSQASEPVGSFAVSGTPPTLVNIPGRTVKELFWLPGVVDAIAFGNPMQFECRQFFSSTIDGDSGGLGACQMAEGVGNAFEILLKSETSLCFMKNLPTKANLKAGGIKLIKGKFPNNDITKIFAPGDRARTIQVNAQPINGTGPEEKIFIKIPAAKKNTRNNLLYSAELYFCPPGQPGPRGFNTIQINNEGQLKINVANRSDPFRGNVSNTVSIEGFLTFLDNSVTWDPAATRSATLNVSSNNESLKGTFSITSDNLITQRFRQDFADNISKNFTTSRFTGTDISNVAFAEGAYKGERSVGGIPNTFTGAAEFRDTYYASAPENSLLPGVTAYDLTGDTFFNDAASVNIDTSAYSCNPKVDIEISMVKGNTTLQESLKTCIRTDLDNIQFCRNNPLIQQALSRFRNVCNPNNPPGGGGGMQPPGGGGGGMQPPGGGGGGVPPGGG